MKNKNVFMRSLEYFERMDTLRKRLKKIQQIEHQIKVELSELDKCPVCGRVRFNFKCPECDYELKPSMTCRKCKSFWHDGNKDWGCHKKSSLWFPLHIENPNNIFCDDFEEKK